MGRQNCESTAVHSSIALLQERFRQLERAKEMRQKRELLRMFSEAEQQVKPATKAYEYESSRPFFHSELILSPTEQLQGSRYPETSLRNKQTDLQNTETTNLENLWSKNTAMQITNNVDEPDIDTSLHL
ncbi:hypothetical protein M5689_014434 [Euphorbia peplus]|nr:hypothetical protein M5689_014434 [Euphorbia peplus]